MSFGLPWICAVWGIDHPFTSFKFFCILKHLIKLLYPNNLLVLIMKGPSMHHQYHSVLFGFAKHLCAHRILIIFCPCCAFCGKPNLMDTDGSDLNKTKKIRDKKKLVAVGEEIKIIPMGLTSTKVCCLLATSHHKIFPTTPSFNA